MRLLMLLLCLGCATEEGGPEAGSYRLEGWFYAHAVVTEEIDGGEPSEVFNGPFSFTTYFGPTGEHSYFGALCGPREDHLECSYSRVDRPFGPEYAVVTTLRGTADATAAVFHVEQFNSSGKLVRDWVITEVSTTAPGVAAPRFSNPLTRLP